MTSTDGVPLLTVFTPFHRNIEYLEETIVSVLTQSFTDFEYLMVNDGDRAEADRITARFNDPRIRIITPPVPLGLRESRNAGLREARGQLIALIDSDDLCAPERLRRQVDFLRSHPDHVLVGSCLRLINERSESVGARKYPETDELIKSNLVVFNCIAQPSVMARRAMLLAAGGYGEDYPAAEDYALWLRLARFGRFHNLQEELVAYRIHAGARKNLWLKPTLRDTTRLKIHAIARLGFRATPRAIASIILHSLLLLVPGRVIFWVFRRIFVKG